MKELISSKMLSRQLSKTIIADKPAVPNDKVDKTIKYKKMKRGLVLPFLFDHCYVFIYFAIILMIPAILNFAALKRESTSLMPKEGEQIDMGWGQKMFLMCIGEGLPTVILDAPTGGTSEVWFLIQQQLSKFSKVCVYDRAGLGFSGLPFYYDYTHDPKGDNRKLVSQVATLEQMTNDLRHLVTIAKPLPRPFILIGSELGGLIARHYALTYPEDVISILLLNPLVEDLFWRQKEDWKNYWNSQVLPTLGSLKFSAFSGISRIAALFGYLEVDMDGESIPQDIKFAQLSHLCNPYHMSAVFHEYYLLNTSFNQMNEAWKAKTFPENVSVTIINTDKFGKIPPLLEDSWQQSQLYLRQSLHPICQHHVTEGNLEQLYKKPLFVTNLTQNLINRWKVLNDPGPKVHAFEELKLFTE